MLCLSALPPKVSIKPGQPQPQGHHKATTRPYTRHRIRSTKPPQGHTKATSRPPQGYTKASPRLPQGFPKATPQPPQSQLLRLFQRLEGAETACSPRVLAMMRIGEGKHTGPIRQQIQATKWAAGQGA